MKRFIIVAAICILASFLINVGIKTFVLIPTYSPQVTSISVEQEPIAVLVNKERSKAGLGELAVSDQLNRSAQLKADDMALRDYWSHKDPEGDDPWEWFRAVGYTYTLAGENLARCYTNEQAVKAWMESPTHKANILGNYTEFGFGTVTDNGCVIITNHFGRR